MSYNIYRRSPYNKSPIAWNWLCKQEHYFSFIRKKTNWLRILASQGKNLSEQRSVRQTASCDANDELQSTRNKYKQFFTMTISCEIRQNWQNEWMPTNSDNSVNAAAEAPAMIYQHQTQQSTLLACSTKPTIQMMGEVGTIQVCQISEI